MRGERGVALVLVLILLGVGGIVLVPTLNYASSALRHFGISRDAIWVQYAVEAITQKALWELQYDNAYDCPGYGIISFSDCVGKLGSVTLYDTINNKNVTAKVEIPGALIAPPPPTPTPTGGKCFFTWLTRDTDAVAAGTQTWVKVGQPITYTLWVSPCTTSGANVNLRRVAVRLPPGFTYVAGSSNVVGNITTAEPQQTVCTGPELNGDAGPFFGCVTNDNAPLLDWPSGTTNLSGVQLRNNSPPIRQTFQATPSAYGVFFVEPMVCFFSAASGNYGPCAGDNGIKGGKQAAVVVGLYNIVSSGSGWDVTGSSGADADGVSLISYQGN